ncbi:hypothetical protein [Robbsia andropogonis]|uniref:hypothetical protein n=1 Tax=Robbsia andropogonis TaxID=28092 RepID=UPI000684B4A6|nr:hypothetical protein [Robbsia andropogonis]MCP1119698.1 hypothetical protein [Robbsia andropogonis]MCP1129681.1 hypothetical protein [Robbsia andropogonis]
MGDMVTPDYSTFGTPGFDYSSVFAADMSGSDDITNSIISSVQGVYNNASTQMQSVDWSSILGGGDGTPVPKADDKRPDGDTRSAQQIIDDDPTLKNLGNQSGVRDNLDKQVGDWQHDPDAAYRASEVVDFIDTDKAYDGTDRGSAAGDHDIEGFTSDNEARHGTEAGELQDFEKNGYSQFQQDGHMLQTTNDSHVNKDGTNQDNFEWGMNQVGNVLGGLLGMFGL